MATGDENTEELYCWYLWEACSFCWEIEEQGIGGKGRGDLEEWREGNCRWDVLYERRINTKKKISSLATRRGIEMPHVQGCLGPFLAISHKQLVKVSQSFSHQLPFKSRKNSKNYIMDD